jgi:hypothetical protein
MQKELVFEGFAASDKGRALASDEVIGPRSAKRWCSSMGRVEREDSDARGRGDCLPILTFAETITA